MSFTAEIEGLTELRAAFTAVREKIVVGLREASLTAARAGVEESRANHPYQDRTHDLTDHSHVEQTEEAGDVVAEMVWPEYYASYVNDGTEINRPATARAGRHIKNKPYPFTPQAEAKAAEVLEREANAVVEDAVSAFNAK